MTALPAISVNLEALPDTARAEAFLEVQLPEDIQKLDFPEGVRLHWLINPIPGAEPHMLENAIRNID